jgi:retron-type reverse transcriptase
VLIVKKGAQSIGDYRRISIMHSISKLLAKILTNRLAPRLDSLISQSQSAFIKGQSIQDNFQYVQGVVNHFRQANTHMLLLKLDITKAFDSVRWEYLLEVMEQVGFGPRWRDMMALIWSTTTSRILLNGEPGRPIKHAKGLHQGDPLSPILFIIAMDPLQRLLDMETQEGHLTLIGSDPIKMRVSLYADDAMLFIRPIAADVPMHKHRKV